MAFLKEKLDGFFNDPKEMDAMVEFAKLVQAEECANAIHYLNQLKEKKKLKKALKKFLEKRNFIS